MDNPVTFFEAVGSDAFDWQMQPFNPIPNSTLVRPGAEGGISGGIGPAYDGGPNHATFSIEVASLEEALGKVERLAGRKVMGPIDAGDLSFALFTDPEGHLVGLFKT